METIKLYNPRPPQKPSHISQNKFKQFSFSALISSFYVLPSSFYLSRTCIKNNNFIQKVLLCCMRAIFGGNRINIVIFFAIQLRSPYTLALSLLPIVQTCISISRCVLFILISLFSFYRSSWFT